MILARVVGTIVATRKDPRLEGKKLLIIKPITPEGKDEGSYLIAVDSVGAGPGDLVLLAVEGYCAMTAVGRPDSPIDAAVIGVIDRVDLV